MMKTISALVLLTAVSGFGTTSAEAATRPMFVAGTAIILMQPVSAEGGIDPQAQALYDAIAMPPVGQPGAQAKVIKTAPKDFTLTCGYRGLGVACNMTVKASDRTRVDGASQTAEILVEGAEAQEFYEKLAGVGATAPYLQETADKWIRIESTQDRFYFRFTTKP